MLIIKCYNGNIGKAEEKKKSSVLCWEQINREMAYCKYQTFGGLARQ